ncbi:MAG: hypothetical protein IT572_01045 [Deltaproteobacteria bacterium]|nr:hypothetical protein [Deltaproteobacteria bacterium]
MTLGEGQQTLKKQHGIFFPPQGGQLRQARTTQTPLQGGTLRRRDPAQGRFEIRRFGEGGLHRPPRRRRGENRPVEDLRE